MTRSLGPYPDTEEFDIDVSRILTLKQTKAIKANKKKYRFISNRSSIETSFRLVKYALDLNAFHSKKRKLIKQEIYARLLMYNFCQRIVQDIKIKKKDKQKYTYQINFTESFHIIRTFLRKKKGGMNPPVENMIVKYILPIRPGRKNTRHVSPKKVVCFNYRYN